MFGNAETSERVGRGMPLSSQKSVASPGTLNTVLEDAAPLCDIPSGCCFFAGPGRSPVLPFACCVGLLLSVGRCGRCSCWCRFRARGAQRLVCWGCAAFCWGRLIVLAAHIPPPLAKATPRSQNWTETTTSVSTKGKVGHSSERCRDNTCRGSDRGGALAREGYIFCKHIGRAGRGMRPVDYVRDRSSKSAEK